MVQERKYLRKIAILYPAEQPLFLKKKRCALIYDLDNFKRYLLEIIFVGHFEKL